MFVRYQCRDCGAPLDRVPVRKPGQPVAAYCECADAAWLVLTKGAPVKLVPRLALHAVDVIDDRAVIVPTETVPPLSDR